MVKIVTDSGSDLPPQLAQELGIIVVPLNLHFDMETYRDNVDIGTEEFYRRLVGDKVFPTTSAPAPGIFVELFTKLAEETDEILTIPLSSKLSATYESAIEAKNLVKANCRIEVIDSMMIIGAQMLLVIKAAKAAQSGANLNAISDMVRKDVPRTHVRMAFDTLEYLRRGGRIGKGQAFLGGLLKLNPILGINDGEVAPIARTRSRPQAVDFLVDFARGFSEIEGMTIEDATTPDELEVLAGRISELFPEKPMYRSKVSPVVGAHVGPHVLAVSILGDRA